MARRRLTSGLLATSLAVALLPAAALPAAAATGDRIVVRSLAGLEQGWDVPDAGLNVIAPGPSVRLADRDAGSLRLGGALPDAHATDVLPFELDGDLLADVTGVRFKQYVPAGAAAGTTAQLTLTLDDDGTARTATWTPASATAGSWSTKVAGPTTRGWTVDGAAACATDCSLAEVAAALPAATLTGAGIRVPDNTATEVAVDMVELDSSDADGDHFVIWDFEPSPTRFVDDWTVAGLSQVGTLGSHVNSQAETGADAVRGVAGLSLATGAAATLLRSDLELGDIANAGFASAIQSTTERPAKLLLRLEDGSTATWSPADQTTGVPTPFLVDAWYWLDAIDGGNGIWRSNGCANPCTWTQLVAARGPDMGVLGLSLVPDGTRSLVDGLYLDAGTYRTLLDLDWIAPTIDPDPTCTSNCGGSGGGGGGGGATTPEDPEDPAEPEGPVLEGSTGKPIPAPLRDPVSVTQASAPGGTDVTTDIEGDGPTATKPSELTILSAIAGDYDLRVWDFSGDAEDLRRFLGWRIQVADAPVDTARHTLRFDLLAAPMGISQSANLRVHLGGIAIPTCADDATGPCLQGSSTLDGIISLVVRAAAIEGQWTFSVAQDAAAPLHSACPDGAYPTDRFVDDDESGHEASIDCLSWYGVTQGLPDGTYGPGLTVTRGQMATFLWRLLRCTGLTAPADGQDWFSDDNGNAHEEAINALRSHGIYLGDENGMAAAGQPVTRAQVSSFIDRTFTLASTFDLLAGVDSYTDVASSNPHANAISRLVMAGIVRGVNQTQFFPNDRLTRAQMGSLMMRLADSLIENRLVYVGG